MHNLKILSGLAIILLFSLNQSISFASNTLAFAHYIINPVNDTVVPTPNSAIARADSILKENQQQTILYSKEEAQNFLSRILNDEKIWSDTQHEFKKNLSRLIGQVHTPMDSVLKDLGKFNFELLKMKHSAMAEIDSIPIIWLTDSTFALNDSALKRHPNTKESLANKQVQDSNLKMLRNSLSMPIPILPIHPEGLTLDSIHSAQADSVFAVQNELALHTWIEDSIKPPVFPENSSKKVHISEDLKYLMVRDVSLYLPRDTTGPFTKVSNPLILDSLKYAVHTLLDYIDLRDSIMVHFRHPDGRKTPFWLSSKNDDLQRIWVKNNSKDSITVWVGNPNKHDITLQLDENISLGAREIFTADYLTISEAKPTVSLKEIEPLEEIPILWDRAFSSAFTLNQTEFSNWNKGGESSLATNMEISGRANYHNKVTKMKWDNNARLRYGSIRTSEHGARTNTDILELNSQLNRKLTEKLDFSTVLYSKTQIAKGYNYPNDSVVISKFLNPGTFTLGTGIEYKPFKDQLGINLSPLSYRNTFATDTASIDQTAHGIEKDKTIRHELGGQLVVKNTLEVLKGLKINNSVRLFSNYIEKPQNVDVDWEINFEQKISWFFTVRLSFHIIYDDDIRFPILDSEGEPELLPNGEEIKVPRLQYKQYLGLTLAFSL